MMLWFSYGDYSRGGYFSKRHMSSIGDTDYTFWQLISAMLVVRRCAMTEKRICPVCEYEIPEADRFMCSQCQSELLLDDEKYIAERKIALASRRSETTASSASASSGACLPIIAGLVLILGSAYLLFWGFVDGMSDGAFVIALVSGISGIILIVLGFSNPSKK
jgi:hypothetical protein